MGGVMTANSEAAILQLWSGGFAMPVFPSFEVTQATSLSTPHSEAGQ
jgi:hypothetical protein